MSDLEDRLLRIVRDNVPSSKRAALRRESILREVGVDSLTLVIIVSQFVETFRVPVDSMQEGLGTIRTIGDLLDLGSAALGGSRERAAV
jgi:hypothetical protein